MDLEQRLAKVVNEFQALLRAYAFGPGLDRLAAGLQSELQRHRAQRADVNDHMRLKALSVLAEYLDALGRSSEATPLLRPTVKELMQSLAEWPRELASAPDAASARRLMRQRVWCCCSYAVCLLRANQPRDAAPILEAMRAFVETSLAGSEEFPCHGTTGLIRYYQGVVNRNRGRLNEASQDFDSALDSIRMRLEDKQAKYGASNPGRVHRESIYSKVNMARILGFGHGGIALSRGRYVEARAWMAAAREILAGQGQEIWQRGLEVYGCCATVLVQDVKPGSVLPLEQSRARLTALAEWFHGCNQRNAWIAEAFVIVAEVRLQQIRRLASGEPVLELSLDGLRPRIDRCLKEISRDTGPLSAPAALRLIACLVRARQWKRCETELARFRKAFGPSEDALAEFQVLAAELWMETRRESAARALLAELLEHRPANRAFRARAWALMALCEQRAGQTIQAERSISAARESLEHVQDGFSKVMVEAIAAQCEAPAPPSVAMPYQLPDADARWCDMAYNLDAARLNVVEAVYRRYPGYSVEKLAALMGRGPSWLYAFLSEHREVEWVARILGRVTT